MIQFSVIIPTYNSSGHVRSCLESLARQTITPGEFEVIVSDDASSDETVQIVTACSPSLPQLRVLRSRTNGGPGFARNRGIEQAKGTWLVFLDSDDRLLPGALAELREFVQKDSSVSAIGYNWTSELPDPVLRSSHRVGRRDGQFLGDRKELIRQYLSHRMDGSVIYTAIRNDLVRQFQLHFSSGYHEDVDFIFQVYFHSSKTVFLDKVLYEKRVLPSSITNSISLKHVEGYFRAWSAIGDVIRSSNLTAATKADYLACYAEGTIGGIATRVREVVRHRPDQPAMPLLFEKTYRSALELLKHHSLVLPLEASRTTYHQITSFFMDAMASPGDLASKAERIVDLVKGMDRKSWSCTDLHHSVFLRPDQARTCCKRFFVDGQMRGDVVLFDIPEDESAIVPASRILEAKRELHQKINSGMASTCDGCPFLEFREWGPLNTLDIRYLSLEHHSVCNLKCTYCSTDYYGGKKPNYDLKKMIHHYLNSGVLKNLQLIVWGGGEPVLGRDFDEMITLFGKELPGAQQRILSNATLYSPAVEFLLRNRQGQLVTSVDAGSEDTFKQVRGAPRLMDVLQTLERYSQINQRRVTVKYIFTEGNSSQRDVRQYVSLIRDFHLTSCVFQISADFKQETIDIAATESMFLLYGLLRQAGCDVLYFDDLVWFRLLQSDTRRTALRVESALGYRFIAKSEAYPEVIVWGTGQQANFLLERSHFFKETKVAFFVDATPEKQGKLFHGVRICPPEELKKSNLPVLIAAVQGVPLILDQYSALGLPATRLLCDLIL